MKIRKTGIKFSILLCLFISCETTSESSRDIISIKGSDTEFELVTSLATAFSEKENIVIEVEGEGSTVGLDLLINGEIDVANSSREMTDDEFAQANNNGIEPIQAIIAMDAIAFITHPTLGIDSLSIIQVQKILSGEIKNWKELGGEDLPIRLYGRNENSGTYKFIESRFVFQEGFRSDAKALESNRAIIEAVKADPAGIGYVGAGFIMNSEGKPLADIWAMYLYTDGDHAYSPYQATAVINGDYPLIRPLYQYFNGKPQGDLEKFLKFELSEEGQQIIRDNGFFPISSLFESINRKYGINY